MKLTTGGNFPDISICIANFNGEALLVDCIESVLAQDTDAFIEILVHDDASSDGSLALLKSCYPQVTVLTSNENVGFCISNNRMADAARGKYILLLNNDAALQDDAVHALLNAASTCSEREILTLPQFAWEDGRLINMACHLDMFYNVIPIMDTSEQEPAMVEGACLLIRHSFWNTLGGFPESFGSIAEDANLCCAARLMGAKIHCVPSSGYRHRQGGSFGGNRIHGTQLRTRYRRRYLSERNRIALLISCTPTWLAWPWLVIHLSQLMLEASIFCALKRSTDTWRRIYSPALADAWRRRNSTLDLRRSIQSRRTQGLLEYLKAFSMTPHRLKILLRHGLPEFEE